MNSFIFWNNIASDLLDIDAIRGHLHFSDLKVPAEHKDIGPYSGLMYTLPNQASAYMAENDKALVFCPTPQLGYKGTSGKQSADALLDDYCNNGQLRLPELKNRFALIILDKKSGNVTAAIDKFGIDKLFYTASGESVIISNCLRTLVAAQRAKSGISNQAIYNFIDSHIIPSPLTIYDGNYKLEPSQAITFAGTQVKKEIYWLPHFSESTPQSSARLEEETRHALSQAVNRCGVSETTAAFLSGGLDSSTVAGYMARNNPDRKIATYTMGFAEAGYDETEFAETAARHFGTNLRHYYVTPDDVADAFSHVIQNCDEPFGNSSIIPAYLCARFAHNEGITTMLAGDGGDEIFAGNERYAKQQVFEHYGRVPALIRKGLLDPLLLNPLPYTRMQPFAKAKSYIEQATTPMPDRMERYNFINHFNATAIFEPDFLNSINMELPIQQKREVYNRPTDATMLNRMLYLDWKFTLADNDLIKVNSACALADVKVLYPMLDSDLVDLSTRIPTSLKMEGGKLRSFYKASMKGFLPDEIINKKKHGFGLPFGEWLKKSPKLQARMYDNLSSLKKRHYIEPAFIDTIMHIHRTGAAASYYGTMVWILAVLEEWLASRDL
jgi:asparagine synthase (glutamine-hydrolysing)